MSKSPSSFLQAGRAWLRPTNRHRANRHRTRPGLEFLEGRRLLANSVSTFDDLGLAANTFNNNAGASGQFVDSGNAFINSYSSSFGGIWSGWAISSKTDTTTAGFGNQYSAITGSGASGSPTYAVAFTFDTSADALHPADSFVNLASGQNPISIQVTNTTYDYLSMLNGDSFAKKFGPGDFFQLTVAGYSGPAGTGNKVGEVDFYLANFLGSNHTIVNTWQTVDLTSLAGAKSLKFGLQSSDNDPTFGMNTPAFFAADNLTVGTGGAGGGSVSGVVFNDLNHNGVKENGEGGLQNWVVQLYSGSTLVASSSPTDSNGNYTISGVAPGNYTLFEVLQSGYTRTAPVSPGNYSVTVTAGGSVTGENFGNFAPILTGLSVTPVDPSLAKGLTQQFVATGTYSDNSTQDLTGQVSWSSTKPSVASITAGGLATGVAPGTSTITATLNGLSSSRVMTVTAAALVSISVTPPSSVLLKGQTRQFTATGTLSDHSTQDLTNQVTWSSATPSVATITATGLATGVATGTSTISASLNGVIGSTDLPVLSEAPPPTTSPVTITSMRVEKVSLDKEHPARKVLVLIVQFSGALGATAAQNLAAYTDFSGRLKRVHNVPRVVYHTFVPMSQAIYNASRDRVILVPAGKPRLPRLEQLEVNVSLLTDPLGRPIHGGKNFTATVTNKRLVVSPSL